MKNSPAYGARNVSRVAAGTGETLSARRREVKVVAWYGAAGVAGAWRPYNRKTGKGLLVGGESEAAVVPVTWRTA